MMDAAIDKYLKVLEPLAVYMMPEEFSRSTHEKFEFISVAMRKLVVLCYEQFLQEYSGCTSGNDLELADTFDVLSGAGVSYEKLGRQYSDIFHVCLERLGWSFETYGAVLDNRDANFLEEQFFEELADSGMSEQMVLFFKERGLYDELQLLDTDYTDFEISLYTCDSLNSALYPYYMRTGRKYTDDGLGELASRFENINFCGLIAEPSFWLNKKLYFLTISMNVYVPETGCWLDVYDYYLNPAIPFLAAKLNNMLKMYQP